jgi:hypothetical protein
VHGDLKTRVDPGLYPVQLTSVDGDFSMENPRAVAPGVRSMRFVALGGRSAAPNEAKVVLVKVEPCTRYYFAARRETPLSRDWSLVLERTEPVEPCDAAAEIKKAGSQYNIETRK